MNVLVTTEARFDRTPDGAIWTQTSFNHRFWSRYLDVFDRVRVLARVRDVVDVPSAWRRVDGDGVAIAPVPHYQGAWEYLERRRDVATALRRESRDRDAVLFRLPTMFAAVLHRHLRADRRPYGVEVCGDPYDGFAPGAIEHPLRALLRFRVARQQRRLCRGAAAAAYVTQSVLQRRYPPGDDAISTHYSSVDLDHQAFVAAPRAPRYESGVRTLLGVGTLSQLYKGANVLIDALRLLVDDNVDVRMVWVGDGACQSLLERRAQALQLTDRIRFAGELLPGEAVIAEFDRADLFVMPSRTEGLPRAMIEAMARGLPCIGSHVGGIPELLPPEEMVPPGDPKRLAGMIRAILSDPQRMASMSRRNLSKALEYRADVLQVRRVAMYRSLREQTAAWAANRFAAGDAAGNRRQSSPIHTGFGRSTE
jgi:glycosyltransferase involved in cell wall biosynthesis